MRRKTGRVVQLCHRPRPYESDKITAAIDSAVEHARQLRWGSPFPSYRYERHEDGATCIVLAFGNGARALIPTKTGAITLQAPSSEKRND